MPEASKLLTGEHPLALLPLLAQKIGLNEAIVLQQVHYWALKQKNVRDGRAWVHNTYPHWQEQFPFWSLPTIKRIFLALEKPFEPKEGDPRPARGPLLISDAYDKRTLNQTKWYAVDYPALYALVGEQATERVDQIDTIVDQLDPIGVSKRSHRRINLIHSYKEQRLSTETQGKTAPAPAHEGWELPGGSIAFDQPDGTVRIVRPEELATVEAGPEPPDLRPRPATRFGLTEAQSAAFFAYVGREPGRSDVPALLAALERVPDATDEDLIDGGGRGRKWWKDAHGTTPPANRLESLVRGIGEAIVARRQAEAEARKPQPPKPYWQMTFEEKVAHDARERAALAALPPAYDPATYGRLPVGTA